jgi:hypothetical protein
MGTRSAVMWVGALVGVAAITGCSAAVEPTGGEQGKTLQESRQAFYSTRNGLRAINGLNSKNGMNVHNGLSSKNGLSARNGVASVNGLSTENGMNSMNGLVTRNGMNAYNGLPVDCSGGKVVGTSCTGDPDGLMNATTGLMRTGDEDSAVYVVRCALAANDSITILDQTGSLITLNGELGLTPSWKTGYLDANGMEAISGCLMAMTNGHGVHVHIELNGTGSASVLGTHSTASTNWFKFQEAAFFGNLFVSPPTSQFCVAKDYANVGSWTTGFSAVEARACAGYGSNAACPYQNAGTCESSSNWNWQATSTNEIDAIGSGSNTASGGCINLCSVSGDNVCHFATTSSGGWGGTNHPYIDVTTCATNSSSPQSSTYTANKDWSGAITSYTNTWSNVVYTYKLDVFDDMHNAQ